MLIGKLTLKHLTPICLKANSQVIKIRKLFGAIEPEGEANAGIKALSF